MKKSSSIIYKGVSSNDEPDEDLNKRIRVDQERFLNLQGIDLKGLVDIFNSYATKKTVATGFFNLALIATNFTQLKQLLNLTGTSQGLGVINTIVLFFVCISLILQLVVGVVLVFLAKHREFIDLEKRKALIRSNNAVTLLIATISIINVFINVFLNV